MSDSCPPTIDLHNWLRFAAPAVDPGLWTVIIPAAGRGSRLAFDQPKILFPVAGRPILEWLLDLFRPRCQRAIIVLSPSGVPAVEPELRRLALGQFHIAVQSEPRGMGDAVDVGAALVETTHTAVVWGDQVALRPESIEAIMRLHQGSLAPDVTCPTVMRADPYIHFVRHTTGRISGVLQAREGDAMPDVGESDTGFFCFRTEVLRRLLTRLRERPGRGSRTGELNLLPVIPMADESAGGVITPRIMTVEETVGVNSAADAALLEDVLRHRGLPGAGI